MFQHTLNSWPGLRSVVTLACIAACAFHMSCGKSESADDTASASATSAPAAVLTEIAAWKSIGGVTDARELPPKPTGGRNAADLHRPLISVMTSMSAADEAMIKSPWDREPTTLKYVLESYERELSTIREALALPYCNWDAQYEQGMDMELPHLAYSRSVARLFVVEAIVRADANDYLGAAASIQDIFRLSDQIGTDPIALTMAVRFSLDQLALEAIHQLFYEKGIDQVEGLRQALAKRNYRNDIKRALLGEGAIFIGVYRSKAGSATGPIEQQPMSSAVADELVWYLRMTRTFVDQAMQPYHQMTALADAPPRPRSAVVDERFTNADQFDRMCRWAAGAENYAAVARLAMELRERKEKSGAFPDPADMSTPRDVLTGENMGYSRKGDGFVIRFSHFGFGGTQTDAEWEW